MKKLWSPFKKILKYFIFMTTFLHTLVTTKIKYNRRVIQEKYFKTGKCYDHVKFK